jgi:ankyrin repeat protein
MRARVLLAALAAGQCLAAHAQVAPGESELKRYTGLHRAAAYGDVGRIRPGSVDARDGYGRTPLHVAAFRRQHEAMAALVAAGADPNALENDRYDIVTIAAAANDVPTLKLALKLGASAQNVTSRYDGTALIAAAHLGHAEVLNALLDAGADPNIADRGGVTPLAHARARGYGGMVRLLQAKNAR